MIPASFDYVRPATVDEAVAALAAAAGLVPGPPGDLGQERARALLLELGGASAASRQRNLDRHWRNIRTITLHNPVAYKARNDEFYQDYLAGQRFDLNLIQADASIFSPPSAMALPV